MNTKRVPLEVCLRIGIVEDSSPAVHPLLVPLNPFLNPSLMDDDRFQPPSSHKRSSWMTTLSSLRSGIPLVRSATTASHPCTIGVRGRSSRVVEMETHLGRRSSSGRRLRLDQPRNVFPCKVVDQGAPGGSRGGACFKIDRALLPSSSLPSSSHTRRDKQIPTWSSLLSQTSWI